MTNVAVAIAIKTNGYEIEWVGHGSKITHLPMHYTYIDSCVHFEDLGIDVIVIKILKNGCQIEKNGNSDKIFT